MRLSFVFTPKLSCGYRILVEKTQLCKMIPFLYKKGCKTMVIVKQGEQSENGGNNPFEIIIGSSPEITVACNLAKRAARGDSTVLMTGETGVGKSLFAKIIHQASPRRKGPFVTVNCAAIPETLIESEFFGYVDGAFTGASKKGKPGKFELATGGTVFLDEIGDMSLILQAKVLRVLQERIVERLGGTVEISVDVRLIAATNKDLTELMESGKFREDLYYRLNVIAIRIPPLRERCEDIPEFVDWFLMRLNKVCGTSVTHVHPGVMEAFIRYPWPGNLRELENALERALNLTDEDELRLEHIPPHIWQQAIQNSAKADAACAEDLDNSLAKYERDLIIAALKATGNNRTQAARILNISRSGLYKKLKRYGITGDGTLKSRSE